MKNITTAILFLSIIFVAGCISSQPGITTSSTPGTTSISSAATAPPTKISKDQAISAAIKDARKNFDSDFDIMVGTVNLTTVSGISAWRILLKAYMTTFQGAIPIETKYFINSENGEIIPIQLPDNANAIDYEPPP